MRSVLCGSFSKTFAVAVALVGLAAAGCSSAAEGEPEPAPARLGTASSAVIKGTSSPASQDSVVMLQFGEGFCSGTLIAPNVVLTARHCVTNLAQDQCGTFQGDIAPATLGVAVGATSTETSPAVAHAKKYFYVQNAKDLCGPYDIALIVLDKEIAGAKTSPVRSAPVTVGETFVAVGYGEDENKQVSVRRQRTGVQALAVGPATKTFAPADGAAPYDYEVPLGEFVVSEAVCHGDSGGPLFDKDGRVVGVTSRGTDPNDVCVARPDIFSAVAQHMDIVDAALKEAGHPRSADTTTKPQSEPDTSDDAASTSDDEEEQTPAPKPKKKTTLTPQPSAGCSVTSTPTGANGSGTAATFGLALVALGLVRSRRRR
jgi:MYXO-CTERM domain-containing protein